jgi:hypothetical protein
MLKKVSSFVGVILLSLIGVFSFGTDEAKADYSTGYQYFKTEDGKWDGRITTNSADRNVRVIFGTVLETEPANLEVRLCNASTGACTGWAEMGTEYQVTFTGMKIGTFNVDIKDHYDFSVYGERNIKVY